MFRFSFLSNQILFELLSFFWTRKKRLKIIKKISKALNFPIGSEIIVTAINIPDMIKVIRNHGLIPVPVEIKPETLGTDLEMVKKAFTSKVNEKSEIFFLNFLD
jgi:hypothetical protein